MKKLKIIIERGKDQFGAWADNAEGIYGAGGTVEEAKSAILEAIRLTREHNTPENIPAILRGEYEILWTFDTESLLNYYGKILTKAAFERLTGINQKQIQHYATGYRKPRPAQVKKIEAALHKLGNELQSLALSF